VVSAADPLRSLVSAFYTGAATFLSSSSSFSLTRAEWTPFQTHCYAENLVALGIEPGTSGLAARNSDHVTTEAVPLLTPQGKEIRPSKWVVTLQIRVLHMFGSNLGFALAILVFPRRSRIPGQYGDLTRPFPSKRSPVHCANCRHVSSN
jgi:hypothetical protein